MNGYTRKSIFHRSCCTCSGSRGSKSSSSSSQSLLSPLFNISIMYRCYVAAIAPLIKSNKSRYVRFEKYVPPTLASKPHELLIHIMNSSVWPARFRFRVRCFLCSCHYGFLFVRFFFFNSILLIATTFWGVNKLFCVYVMFSTNFSTLTLNQVSNDKASRIIITHPSVSASAVLLQCTKVVKFTRLCTATFIAYFMRI